MTVTRPEADRGGDVASLYPPAPPGIPADAARPGLRFRLAVVLVVLTLFLFLLIYLAFLAGALYLAYWAWAMPHPTDLGAWLSRWYGYLFFFAIRIGIFAIAATLVMFLFKGFLKRGDEPTSDYVAIAEHEQPELFLFIRSLCHEIGTAMPERVYLSHEVNASVLSSTSILDLVIDLPRSLVIGMGLVNVLNLVEFKSLLAHELGHYSQRSLRLSSYAFVAYRAIHNMIYAQDRWDTLMVRWANKAGWSVPAGFVYMLAESMRAILKVIFRVLSRVHPSLLRQMEYNADLVAVSVVGSDAPVHVLLKSEFGQACLHQAARDLAVAAEHGLYTRDLFLHQQQSADFLRTRHEDPDLGRPPVADSDSPGPVQVFQPGDATTASIWADHPSHYDREVNAKRRYWPGSRDDRSAWLLFSDQPTLRAEVTRRFYTNALDLAPDGPLSEPESVQAFTEEEHAACTFDPRYQGIYDGRCLFIEPEDIDRMLAEVEADNRPALWVRPSSMEELDTSKLQRWVTDLEELYTRELQSWVTNREDWQVDTQYLTDFDASVFRLHYHLARAAGREQELCQRYRLHLEIQQLTLGLVAEEDQVNSIRSYLSSGQSVSWSEVPEILERLQQVRAALAEVLEQAGRLRLPSLTHVEVDEPLARFLPADPPVADIDPYRHSLDLAWMNQLHEQVLAVLDPLHRILFKSLGSILRLQERLLREARERTGHG